MARIGLIDVDGHNGFPNLALMKLSAYHKLQGDEVEFVDAMFGGEYDRVYMSKVFTNTPDYNQYINSKDIIKGGTGYKDYTTVLDTQIEHICPDYSLYGVDYAVGFLTRGCPNKCAWCVVPKKEGFIRQNQDIEEFLGDMKQAILLDNNVLAHEFGLSQIQKIIDLGIKIDFNQGLDARLIGKSPQIVDLLSKVKWIRYIRLACDTKSQIKSIEECFRLFAIKGIKPSKFFIYTIIKDFEDSVYRIYKMRKLGANPFGQPYLDFTGDTKIPQWQKDLARWCNHRALFHSIDFWDYEPRKGFKCSWYFEYFGVSIDMCK